MLPFVGLKGDLRETVTLEGRRRTPTGGRIQNTPVNIIRTGTAGLRAAVGRLDAFQSKSEGTTCQQSGTWQGSSADHRKHRHKNAGALRAPAEVLSRLRLAQAAGGAAGAGAAPPGMPPPGPPGAPPPPRRPPPPGAPPPPRRPPPGPAGGVTRALNAVS